tara:strand:- start:6950 stop:8230 length:1281 start_codon:yes stop_codon:yes gene_type:complete
MLSKQAFNALLKTLEEPPKYLKFIFATTEVNKIPITVLSRCQRFDLMRISFDELLNFLKKVTSSENKSLNEDILKLIVKMSEGSVRDSLSLLDRIFLSENDNGKKINLKTAQEIFGYFDKSYLIDLIIELMKGNETKVLELYRNIYNQGIEPKLFLNNFLEIIYYLKNCKNLKNTSQSIDLSDLDLKRIEELSNQVDAKTLILFWEFSIDTISQINIVSNQNLALEMFLIRLLYLKKKNVDENDLAKNLKIESNNSENNEVNENLPQNLDMSSNNKTINQIKFSSQEKKKILLDEENFSNKIEIKTFNDLILTCIDRKEIGLKYELENNVNLISFKNNNIEISFNENLDNNFIKNLTSKLLDWTGERWIILLSKEIRSKSVKEKMMQSKKDNLKDLKNSEIYKKAITVFSDLDIVDVKELKERDDD